MKNRIWPLLFAVAVFGAAAPAFAQTIFTPYAFTNFAGNLGGAGNADGPGTAARFNNPVGMAVDSATNLYVADEFNDTIRKMSRVGTNWMVTTLAGSARIGGTADGTNSVARFVQPTGVAVDSTGNLYVADQTSCTIRKITPDGVVTTLAGLAGSFSSQNGSNSVARFNRPAGVAVDPTGTKIYVADAGNYTIRQIVSIGTNWAVTTIAGTHGFSGYYDGTNGTIRFGVLVLGPQSLALDSDGNLIVADTGNSAIRKLTQVGTNWIASTLAGNGNIGTADGTNTQAQFYNPLGVAMDSMGNIYVTDGNFLVRKITPIGTNWVTSTLAGGGATLESVDGLGNVAAFKGIGGIAVDGAGTMYVADMLANTIRQVTPAGTKGLVTTIAGIATHWGTNDGIGSAAKFYLPFGVTADTASNLYVGDQSANLIRKITPDGTVTTLVGDSLGGVLDGTNTHAGIRQPSCLALDGAGNIYFADAGNYRVRRVSPIGTNWVVKTLAGGAGPGGPGSKDGTNNGASFSFFFGLCVDAATNIYVADTGNSTIRKVSPQGTNWVVTTIAGTAGNIGGNDGTNKNAQFYNPYGIAVDSATNLYVADWNHTIRKISPSGTNWVTTTIAGFAGFFGSADGSNSVARFLYPQGITIDPAGNLYVSDGGNGTIRRLSRQGTNWVVTTLGGGSRPEGVGQAGSTPGIGGAARVNNVYGLSMSPDGNLYIADAGENVIVKASPLFLFDTSATTYTASSNSMQLRVTGPPGSNVVVQISSGLANWAPVATNVIPPIGLNVSIPATNGTGLFRAVLMP